MPLPAISHRRHSVFRLSVSVRDHILQVYEHDMLQTAHGNFTNFTIRCTQGQR